MKPEEESETQNVDQDDEFLSALDEAADEETVRQALWQSSFSALTYEQFLEKAKARILHYITLAAMALLMSSCSTKPPYYPPPLFIDEGCSRTQFETGTPTCFR